MKLPILILLSAALSYAAVDGTVINGTTGKPQGNATVTLYKVGGNGPESIQSVKSGPDGKFVITADATGAGPRLVQAAFDGAVYNHMIPPGAPANGITVTVYQSSTKASDTRVDEHVMILQPDGKNLTVTELYDFMNGGKFTYNDPDKGTLRFWLPAGAHDAEVNVQAPGSVPVRRAPQKTAQPNVMKLDVPILPGQTRVDVSYAMPFTTPGDFDVKTFYKGNATKLAAPPGVTFTAEGMQNLGQEPKSKATIYGISAPAVTIHVEGAIAPQETTGGDSGDSGQNTLMQILPRLYQSADPAAGFPAAVSAVKWILLPAFGILALGFVLLYRKATL
jgi:hypothetical protein